MRIIRKILFFPITLALSIVVAILRLLCQMSSIVLALISMLILAIGLCTIVLMQNTSEGFGILGLAFLVSPFGIPLIATLLVELLGGFNELLKGI